MKTRVFTLLAFLVTLALLFGPALAGALAQEPTPPVPASHHAPDEAVITAAVSPSSFNTFPASSATRSHADIWHIETVDSGGAGPPGWDNSLALDGLSRPHISYCHGTYPNYVLKYAWHDGGTWHIETVDSAGGWYTSLALDGVGRPHISYHDSANGDLKYARHDGTTWHIVWVPTGRGGGWNNSLALDGSGRPHISYSGGGLKYARHDGVAWHPEIVDSGGGWNNSLALDGAGRPHISYEHANYDLKYAWYDGGTWHIETVDSAGGWDTSLALDGAGWPHISYCYHDYPNFSLKYAWHDGTAWHIETVDSNGDVGWHTSLALDGAGRPHISYHDDTNDDLKYAWHDGTTWHIETVDSGGWYTSLALPAGGTGRPHISYYDYASGDLRCAWRLPSLTLDKQATPQDGLRNSDTLTYTLTFSFETSLSVRLWDPLPANVHYVSNTIASNVTPPAAYSPTAQAVVWQGMLLTDTAYMVRFQATPGITGTGALSLSAPIVNTAWLTDMENDRSALATVIVNARRFYLPLVLRGEL